MATQTSYDWIREIKPELHALDEIPLTGAAPAFPWDQFSSRLSASLEKKIKVTPGEVKLRTKDRLFEGLGENPFPLIVSIPSLLGNAAWIMPQQEMATLEALLLTKEEHPLLVEDQTLSKAFYKFLALEALYNIGQLKVDKSLAPILSTEINCPQEDALTWDISVTIDQRTLWGRLLVFPELRKSWINHFSKQGQASAMTKELAKKVETVIHLEVGKIALSAQEWSTIRIGDWLALDHFYLDQSTMTGRVMLTINEKNIFIGRLKESDIKIVEFPLYNEVNESMAKKPEDHEDLTDFDDHTIEEGDDSSEEMTEDFDLDETLNSDFLHEATHGEEEVSLTNETPLTRVVSDKESTKGAKKQTSEDKPQTSPLSTGLDTKHIATKDIPITLIVELGQIQMSMEKLLLLEPGNVLDLNVRPENGIDLVINGKRVGKAELVRLGESMGIRILELG